MSNLAQYWLPKDVVLMSFCSLFWCSDINRKWTLSRYKNIQMFYGMHTASGLFPIINIIFQIILYSGLVYAIWQPPALFSLFRICVSVFLFVCLFVWCRLQSSFLHLFCFSQVTSFDAWLCKLCLADCLPYCLHVIGWEVHTPNPKCWRPETSCLTETNQNTARGSALCTNTTAYF